MLSVTPVRPMHDPRGWHRLSMNQSAVSQLLADLSARSDFATSRLHVWSFIDVRINVSGVVARPRYNGGQSAIILRDHPHARSHSHSERHRPGRSLRHRVAAVIRFELTRLKVFLPALDQTAFDFGY